MTNNGILSNGALPTVLQSNSMQNHLLKYINKKLAAGKKKKEGMMELKSFLNECSDYIFTENCVKWMQYCCMIDEADLESSIINLQVLRALAESAVKFPELGKPVSNSVVSRFNDVFIKHLTNYEEAWITFEALLWSYNGPFGPIKDGIVTLMNKRMADEKISMAEARCYALLPSAGGGGTKGAIHKTNWHAQFMSLVNDSHALLNQLFKDIQELQVYDVEKPADSAVSLSFSDLVIHLHNHSLVLQAMLLGRYPAAKLILPEKVLDLVCRGLLVTGKYLGESELASTAELRTFLPQIHVILFKTLAALIVACSRTLLPCAGIIVRLIKQSLQSSPSPPVRLSCYSCISNWLAIAGSGSCTETLAKILVPVLLGDIEYATPIISLRDSNKKSDVSVRKMLTVAEHSESLCFAALEVLQEYLSAIGFLLPPDMHMTIQGAVIRLASTLQSRCESESPIYGKSERCRRGLYSVLLQLCLEPCPKWPPPTQFATKLFSVGRQDSSPLVAQTCCAALSVIDRIIHPEFKTAAFPVDYKAVLQSQLDESSSVQLLPRYQSETNVPSSVAFFRQFMDKATGQTRADLNSTVPPVPATAASNRNSFTIERNNDVSSKDMGEENYSGVADSSELISTNSEHGMEVSHSSEVDDTCRVEGVEKHYNEESKSADDFLNEGKDDILEGTPAKKRKVVAGVTSVPLKMSRNESPSQESVSSDASSLPCSQIPSKVLSEDSSNLGCSQVLTQTQLGTNESSIVGSSQPLTQLEIIPEESLNATLESMSSISSDSSSIKPGSQVEKLKGDSVEKIPERQYSLRSKISQEIIDSPMILRSGVLLSSPSTALERKGRRRAGSVSSATSQSSRCREATVSPRSEICDADVDIIADFEDTLKPDD